MQRRKIQHLTDRGFAVESISDGGIVTMSRGPERCTVDTFGKVLWFSAAGV